MPTVVRAASAAVQIVLTLTGNNPASSLTGPWYSTTSSSVCLAASFLSNSAEPFFGYNDSVVRTANPVDLKPAHQAGTAHVTLYRAHIVYHVCGVSSFREDVSARACARVCVCFQSEFVCVHLCACVCMLQKRTWVLLHCHVKLGNLPPIAHLLDVQRTVERTCGVRGY